MLLQVTQEVAPLSAVATMDELLEATKKIDESLDLRNTALQQQTTGSRPQIELRGKQGTHDLRSRILK